MFGLFKRQKAARSVNPPRFRPTLEALEARTLLSTAGALDPTFGTGGKVIGSYTQVGASRGNGIEDIVLQTDGKIVAAGVDGGGHVVIARYNADGSLDKTFNGTGQRTLSTVAPGLEGCSLALAPDGKLVVATTEVYGPDEESAVLVTRLNANGSLDPTFGAGGSVETKNKDNLWAVGVAVQPDGKVVVAANVSGQTFGTAEMILRYTSTGQLDGTFGSAKTFYGSAANGDEGQVDSFIAGEAVKPDDGENWIASSVAIQADGKILVGGSCAVLPSGIANFSLTRYTTNGALDASFGAGGRVATAFGNLTSDAASIAIGPDGKIVLAGVAAASGAIAGEFALAQYNSNGSLDGTFGSGGRVLTNINSTYGLGAADVAVQQDGQVIAVGTSWKGAPAGPPAFALLRYDTNGKLDTSFGAAGEATPAFYNLGAVAGAVALTPDGRIVVGGGVGNGSNIAFALARYLPGTAQPVLAQLSVTAPAKAVDGTSFQFTVTALDTGGQPFMGSVGTVVVTTSDGAAILPQAYNITAGDKGKHTFTITLRTRGPQTVKVALEDTEISSTFTVLVD